VALFLSAISKFMKVYTLIDITETKQHKSNSMDNIAINQQANFMTFVQTLTLRTNIYFDQSPTVEKISTAKLKKLGFGEDYKGSHHVWTLECKIDEGQEFPNPIDLLKDFDLVPVVSGLNETIKINNNVFRAQGKQQNIVIE